MSCALSSARIQVSSFDPRGDGSFRARIHITAASDTEARTQAVELLIRSLNAAGKRVSTTDISQYQVEEEGGPGAAP
jgi:hypothetical protein